jgi:hypothetical protein
MRLRPCSYWLRDLVAWGGAGRSVRDPAHPCISGLGVLQPSMQATKREKHDTLNIRCGKIHQPAKTSFVCVLCAAVLMTMKY